MAPSSCLFLLVIASAAVLQVTARTLQGQKCVNKTLSSWQWQRESEDVGGAVASLTVNVEHYDHAHYCTEGHGFGYNGSEVWVDHGCRAQFTLCIQERPYSYCDEGWTASRSECYKFGGKATFYDARKKCQEEGADLPSPTDQRKNALVKFMMKGRGKTWLSGKKENGVWTWMDTGKRMRWTNWYKKFVNGDCAVMKVNAGGKWQKTHCDNDRDYYCVKPHN